MDDIFRFGVALGMTIEKLKYIERILQNLPPDDITEEIQYSINEINYILNMFENVEI